MFIEEDFETYIINLLESERTATPQLEVKTVARIGSVSVTLDTLPQFAKITPAVIVGVLDNEEISQVNSRADSQMLAYEMRVFLLVKSKASPSEKAAKARPILRQLRTTLRGLLWTAANGATEGPARVFYRSQEVVADNGGVALYLQTYEVRTMDSNDIQRSL